MTGDNGAMATKDFVPAVTKHLDLMRPPDVFSQTKTRVILHHPPRPSPYAGGDPCISGWVVHSKSTIVTDTLTN